MASAKCWGKANIDLDWLRADLSEVEGLDGFGLYSSKVERICIEIIYTNNTRTQ